MKTTSKTIKRARLILMAVLVLAVLSIGVHPQPASATQGGPPIPVNCGDVINVPGNYILTGNLNCVGTAVTISFNTDVNFDLKGFTISGDGTGAGILVFPPEALHGVYIHGGTVMGFGTGIGIVGTSLSFRHPGLIVFHVNDMTITGNGAGIVLFETGFGHFSGNTISGNVLGVSISLSGENQFNGNTISGNQGMGVRFFSAFFGNQFNSNSVTDNGGGGFDLQPPAFGGCFENLISSNDISRNGGFGVRLFHHNCATVLGNTVNGNPVGIQILGGLGSSFNTIQSNTALGNTTFDLQDDSPDCGTNTWRSNIFGTANQGCIQ